MLFAPCLVREAGGSALPDHIQPVLKLYLFIGSESGNVHWYSPLFGFRILGVNSKNFSPDFTGKRQIFHYTFLYYAYIENVTSLAGVWIEINTARYPAGISSPSLPLRECFTARSYLTLTIYHLMWENKLKAQAPQTFLLFSTFLLDLSPGT